MVHPDHQPDQMRHDDADEADGAADRYSGTRRAGDSEDRRVFQALHGQTEMVTGKVEITRKSGQYDVKVRFPLRINAFQITKPTYLGVGVANDIEVTVRATLSPASGPTR